MVWQRVWQQGVTTRCDNKGMTTGMTTWGRFAWHVRRGKFVLKTARHNWQNRHRLQIDAQGMTTVWQQVWQLVWQQNTVNIGIQNGTLTQNAQHARHPCLLPTCGWGGPLQQLEELCATWGALCRRMRMYRSCICIRMYMYMDIDFCNGLASRQYIYHCFYNELHCFCKELAPRQCIYHWFFDE